jgi:hypothetical protein
VSVGQSITKDALNKHRRYTSLKNMAASSLSQHTLTHLFFMTVAASAAASAAATSAQSIPPFQLPFLHAVHTELQLFRLGQNASLPNTCQIPCPSRVTDQVVHAISRIQLGEVGLNLSH